MPSGDHDLLHGVLGVQSGLFEPSHFAHVLSEREDDSSLDFIDHLLRMAYVSERDSVLLRKLVDDALELHGGDTSVALASLGGRERVSQILSEVTASEVLTQLKTSSVWGASGAYSGEEGADLVDEAEGRYEHAKEYSRGGMGRILLVHDRHLNRQVILKELLPSSTQSGTTLNEQGALQGSKAMEGRFLREARITGQLEHPSIMPVYEVGQRPNGTIYYTMKFVRGQTMRKAIKSAASLEERLKLLQHFVDLCQAIAYAHSRGVVHRDIKPANVMIGEFGETVVLDWGLAKVLNDSPRFEDVFKPTPSDVGPPEQSESLSMTRVGTRLGTPSYMSPEQAEGRIQDIDERSDVYSLGLVLYELLVGHRPFTGTSTDEILAKIISEPAPPIGPSEPSVPVELISICETALRKNPDERYQSARSMAEDIERFQSGALVQAYDYSFRDHARRTYANHRTSLSILAAAIVLLLALGVYSYLSIFQARNAAVQAKDLEVEARNLAEREAYISQIRLAQSYVTDRNFSLATKILWKTTEEHRNWEWGYLLNLCNLDLFTIAGHSARLYSAEFSPDGSRILTVSADETVRVWDSATGVRLRAITFLSPRIETATFSPDGASIGVALLDGSAQVWGTDTGKLLAEFRGHSGSVNSVAFSPDGSLLVTASVDGTARIWDTGTGQTLATLTGHRNGAKSAAFSPDGTQIVTESDDSSVRIWNAATGSELRSVAGRQPRFSFDGTRLVTVDRKTGTVWDADSGTMLAILAGHIGSVGNAEFSPTGELVVTASDDGAAKIWDAGTGSLLASLEHGEPVKGVRFSPDGSLLLTFSAGGLLKVWEVETGELLSTLFGHSGLVTTAEFSPDGARILTASADKTAKVWNAQGVSGHFTVANHTKNVKDVVFSRDGKSIATISWDNSLRIIDATSFLDTAIYSSYSRFGASSIDFSPDGTYLVAVLDEFSPIVFDLVAETVLTTFTKHTGRVESAEFSPDGTRIVSTSWDGTARVWDAQTGDELLILSGHADRVLHATYSPGGARILSASADKTAKVWDARTGAELLTLRGHERAVNCASFSPDGSRGITGSADGTAKVWDLEGDSEPLTLAGHSANVLSAEFSPDGMRIVTASWDRTVKIWDARKGTELVTILGQTSALNQAVFSPDGRRLLAASLDGKVFQWESVPWSRIDSSGNDRTEREDRIALVKELRMGVRSSTHAADEGPSTFVVTTREIARDRLERLHGVLRSESEEPHEILLETGGEGLVIAEGPRLNALLRLCFVAGDRILRINDVVVTDERTALRALERLLLNMESGRQPSLKVETMRGDQRCLIEFLFQEPSLTRKTIRPERQQATLLARATSEMLQTNAHTIIKNNRDFSQDMGEPLNTEDGLNGVWAIVSANTSESNRCFSPAIVHDDHLVRINCSPITSIGDLKEYYEKSARTLAAGRSFSEVLEIERGEFQRLEITTIVE